MMARCKFKCLLLGLTLISASATADNLMVEVRIDGQNTASQQGMGVGINDGGWGLQGRQRTVTRRETNVQRLMVMDGGTATLSSVQTQPLRLRQVIFGPYGKIISESYVYRSLGGGIRVTPRSRGEMVVIDVSADDARPVSGQQQAIEVLQLSTQISGRMGEWIMIGDDQRSGGGSGGGYGGAAGGGSAGGQFGGSSGDSSSGQQVWLRVMPAAY